MIEVMIDVTGGVVTRLSIPDEVKVICRDYDIQNEYDVTGEDENGEYREYEL